MKTRDYLVKAKKCEKRATKMHRLEDREWQLVLAQAYRILAESEMEAAAQRKRQEGSGPSTLVGSPSAVPVPTIIFSPRPSSLGPNHVA
jgi:hypothetical protein